MSTLVSLENVVKRYKRGKQSVEVLHGVNLSIEQGEFLGNTPSDLVVERVQLLRPGERETGNRTFIGNGQSTHRMKHAPKQLAPIRHPIDQRPGLTPSKPHQLLEIFTIGIGRLQHPSVSQTGPTHSRALTYSGLAGSASTSSNAP